ncbi:hypothetical protein [Stenotrophomonas tumulicola]|uniref:PepSY domain-containing protein n=1 Tax=Stenotrophomonas tumulicola TaxID=1685415 RepID=A0A7W3IJ32_9GAMM|nr:hypothetical protein [Stenotrophomonas tumulicola]MBA8682234.1 hypothetical protein [Stenotrophomonas tumulicola]
MAIKPTRILPPLALGVVLGLTASAAIAEPSNKWRIDFENRSQVAGEIELSLTPKGGQATNVTVPIPAATNDEAAAVLVSNALSSTFGAEVYEVEIDDGDDVLVRANDGIRNFDLDIVRNTADGLRVELDKE